MSYKVPQGRLRPKKEATFGKAKKPFKSKGRNRLGSMKKSHDGSIREPLNLNKPVKFLKNKYQKRIRDIQEHFPLCQICEESYNLDIPHHVARGANKDDRTMISACVKCHSGIHGAGEYDNVDKTEDECLEIALKNNKYLENL